MKQISFYFLFLLLAACSIKGKKETPAYTITTQTKNDSVRIDKDIGAAAIEEDCVFNNDYYTLTMEWLKEVNETNFTWHPDLYSALIPLGQDTISLSRGGCVHFNISVELKMTNDSHLISDSAFWMQRTLKLADQYGMDHYSKMIREGKVRSVPEQVNDTHTWFEVDDNDPEDNLFYNGIEITFEGKAKRIHITQYFN